MSALPLVSVIIPCRNEGRRIEACLSSILSSDYPPDRLEILVADGESDDGTRETLEEFCTRHSNIRVIDNPGRTVPKGLNLAIRAARGEIIVRIDAHTEYASDYIRECVSVLLSTHADNVGGAARTKSTGFIQTAVSLAYHSPFSVGGARFHNIDHEGYVDTVPYGCWRRNTLFNLGLFDEELVRNQDDELNLRTVRKGGKIWQSPRIRSWYQPRDSLGTLFQQYAQYGYWKVRIIQKHRLPASWRHLVPGIWLGTIVCLVPPAFFLNYARLLLGTILAFYFLACLLASIFACNRTAQVRFIPMLPIVFATYHAGYGYGFLHGFLDFMLLHRRPSRAFVKITRGSKPDRSLKKVHMRRSA
jgi:succinoglycan biosynthesis protein ExoA